MAGGGPRVGGAYIVVAGENHDFLHGPDEPFLGWHMLGGSHPDIASAQFPGWELYGIASRVRVVAISVIAKGLESGTGGVGDFDLEAQGEPVAFARRAKGRR